MLNKNIISTLIIVLIVGLTLNSLTLAGQNPIPTDLEEFSSKLSGKAIKLDGKPLKVGFCIQNCGVSSLFLLIIHLGY